MKMNNVKKQQGFTLIELVVVIVILGILAVTAAPKFINLQSDARTATLQAIKASMESANTLVHSKSLILGNDTKAKADSPTVIVNSAGDIVNLSVGYPVSISAAPVDAAADWAKLLDVNADDFLIADDAIAGYVVVYPTLGAKPTAIPANLKAPNAATASNVEDCFAFYKESTVAGTKPSMGVAVCL